MVNEVHFPLLLNAVLRNVSNVSVGLLLSCCVNEMYLFAGNTNDVAAAKPARKV